MNKENIRKYENVLRCLIRENPCDTASRVLLVRCLMASVLDGSDFLGKRQLECLEEVNLILLLSLNSDELAYARYVISVCRRFEGEAVVLEAERERGQKALKLLRKIQPCVS